MPGMPDDRGGVLGSGQAGLILPLALFRVNAHDSVRCGHGQDRVARVPARSDDWAFERRLGLVAEPESAHLGLIKDSIDGILLFDSVFSATVIIMVAAAAVVDDGDDDDVVVVVVVAVTFKNRDCFCFCFLRVNPNKEKAARKS